MALPSDQASLRKGNAALRRHDDMVEDADVHELQGIGQTLRDAQVCLARFGYP